MTAAFKEVLFESMLALIFLAVCSAIGWFVLFLLSLALWASIVAMIAAIFLFGAFDCYLGLVAIQQWEHFQGYLQTVKRIITNKKSV